MLLNIVKLNVEIHLLLLNKYLYSKVCVKFIFLRLMLLNICLNLPYIIIFAANICFSVNIYLFTLNICKLIKFSPLEQVTWIQTVPVLFIEEIHLIEFLGINQSSIDSTSLPMMSQWHQWMSIEIIVINILNCYIQLLKSKWWIYHFRNNFDCIQLNNKLFNQYQLINLY